MTTVADDNDTSNIEIHRVDRANYLACGAGIAPMAAVPANSKSPWNGQGSVAVILPHDDPRACTACLSVDQPGLRPVMFDRAQMLALVAPEPAPKATDDGGNAEAVQP